MKLDTLSFTVTMRRREFLRMSAWSCAGIAAYPYRALFLPLNAAASSLEFHNPEVTNDPAVPPALKPYVDPLTTPVIIQASHGQHLDIHMQEGLHRAHRDLNLSRVWGYDGTWPGPTIKVKRGQALTVQWINDLPKRHLFALDHTLHGAESSLPEVRNVVHVHGIKVLPESDGYPESWISPDGKRGPTYTGNRCFYPNEQPAATLWYHDHAIGINRLNMYSGLAGFYIIEDEEEMSLNLPHGAFDIPLMLQDRSFAADGSLSYPVAHNGTHPVWVQEEFGDVNCVNGKVAPYLEVEPRKYRFRLLNASNSRFYHLSLLPADGLGNVVGKVREAPSFHQVGTDGGLLASPLPLHYLVMSPAERFDVVVDFSGYEGKNFAVINDAAAPYPRGGKSIPREVMLFKVNRPLSGKDNPPLPEVLVPISPLNPSEAVRERFLGITEMDRASDGYTVMGLLDSKHWDDPVTENPKAGSTEIWSFLNTTGDVHPIHIHLVRFQVLNRQAFDVNSYLQSGKVVYSGIPVAPEANERPAWKDTVKTYPGMITRVIARFDLPNLTSSSRRATFRYVWHCHMLEHEDNDMMRPFDVIA